jgi:hypothetical protein
MGLLDDAIREHLELKRQHGAPDDEISRAEQEALTPARRDPNAAAGAGVPPVEYVEGQEAEPGLADEPPPMQPAATDKPPPPDLDAPPEPLAEEEPTAIDVPDQPTAIRPVPAPPPVEEEILDESEPAEPAPPPHAPHPDEEDDYLAPAPMDDGPAAHPPLESTDPIEAPELERYADESPDAPKPESGSSLDDEYEPDEVPSEEALSPPPGDPYRARTSILDDPLSEEPPPEPEPKAEGEQDVLEETPDFLQETPEHDKLWFEQKPPRDFDFD